jgi:hypothetical protein
VLPDFSRHLLNFPALLGGVGGGRLVSGDGGSFIAA